MNALARLPEADLADDGGRKLDARLWVTDDLVAAVAEAVAADYAILPAGGLTSAINAFGYERAAIDGRFAGVVAIRPKAAAEPELVGAQRPLDALKPHQIAIDPASATVAIGAGLTFEQANAVLEHVVGPGVRVLVDLTSVGSALAGGVLATGGMGPLRLRPSASCVEVALAEGQSRPRLLRGQAAAEIEGLQGWTGMASALRLRYFETPANEFGLVLPVHGTDGDGLADFLAALHPWTALALPEEGSLLAGPVDEGTIVNGIELIGRKALERFAAQAPDSLKAKAGNLIQACDYANADWLAGLTGWSNGPVDEVLGLLMDAETGTIGGVPIDFGVGFSSGAEMESFRAIREGAPDIARSQARVKRPGKLKPWSISTDVNIALAPDAAGIARVLAVYQDYRDAVGRAFAESGAAIESSLSVYGHLSPHGLDPHHRVILTAPEGGEGVLVEARVRIEGLKRNLLAGLVCALGAQDRITGGEKGMPSILELVKAVGGAANLPANLRSELERARRVLAGAPANFSFRAPVLPG